MTNPPSRFAQPLQGLNRLRDSERLQSYILVGVAFIAAVGARWKLFHFYTSDYTDFYRVWFHHLAVHGFFGLADNFADYNPPFLYLMYLGTLTPFSGMTVVKGIAIFFEIIVAAGVFAIVHHLRRNVVAAGLMATGVLLLPELILNAGMWGQTDSIHTAFLVWCGYFVLTKRDIPAWILFALAFAFKLQAAFLLPFLLLAFIVQKHRWRAPLAGLVVLAATYIPALIAGRSVPSLISIYGSQAKSYPFLTMQAPNYFQWIPNKYFDIWQPAGIYIALASVALLTTLFLRSKRREESGTWLLQTAAAYGLVLPFLLPQMHERYFYAGAVFAFICIAIDRRFVIPAVILQITALFSYSDFLYGGQEPAIPLTVVALFQVVAVGWVVWITLVPAKRTAPTLETA